MKESTIKGLIEDAITGFSNRDFKEEIGYVISVIDCLAIVSGLNNAFFEEKVIFDCGVQGVIIGMESEYVSVLICGHNTNIFAGMEVKRSNKFFTVKVGENTIGRILNGFGDPIDDLGDINGTEMPIERNAVEMIDRAPVNEQLVTGVRMVDWLTPIGHGQRESILGNRGTGKTAIAIDIVLNNKHRKDCVFIYVSIGQRINNAIKVLEILKSHNVKNFIVVVANSSDPVAMRYFAPMTGCTLAEYFMDQGKHAIIIYDNLSVHAVAYREISLIMKRPPGREAYPGDIFYLHSRLLERSCNLAKGGSLTAIPIIEIFEDDMSNYVSTNIISITDGQIVLNSEDFARNKRPAMNVGASVSRVGGDAQLPLLKKLCGSLKLKLSRYESYEEMTKFSSEISDNVMEILEEGRFLRSILIQIDCNPTPMWKQLIILYMALNYFDKLKNNMNFIQLEEICNSLSSEKQLSIINGDVDNLIEILRNDLSLI